LGCLALGNSSSLHVFAERLTLQQFRDNEVCAVLGSPTRLVFAASRFYEAIYR